MTVTGSVPVMDAEDVAKAVARAREAAATWSVVPFAERAAHLVQVRALLLDRLDAIVAVICQETGKIPHEAITTEVFAVCETIEHYRKHGAGYLAPRKV